MTDSKGIGDITSDAKGTGARYNAGKVDYSLIPLRILADSLFDYEHTSESSIYVRAIYLLGLFQENQDSESLWTAFHLFDKDCSGMIQVLEYGKRKYKEWNWLKGQPWSVPLASAVRHMMKIIIDGEECDAESGLKHEWHFKCNVMFLIQYAKSYKEGNDLPPKEYFNAD